jgi:hypothetical protein
MPIRIDLADACMTAEHDAMLFGYGDRLALITVGHDYSPCWGCAGEIWRTGLEKECCCEDCCAFHAGEHSACLRQSQLSEGTYLPRALWFGLG